MDETLKDFMFRFIVVGWRGLPGTGTVEFEDR